MPQAPFNSLSAFPPDSGIEVLDVEENDEFRARQLHARDPAMQLKELQSLARAFVERPEMVLQELVDTAVSLCDADSAGISVERPDKTENDFYKWIATSGEYADFLNAVLPQYPSACGICLERGRPQQLRMSGSSFDLMGIQAAAVTDGILLPWKVDELQGTVWVLAHGRDRAFDGDDVKLMQVLAELTAVGVRQHRQRKSLLDRAHAASATSMANEQAHAIDDPLQGLQSVMDLAAEGHCVRNSAAADGGAIDNLPRFSALVKQLLTTR